MWALQGAGLIAPRPEYTGVASVGRFGVVPCKRRLQRGTVGGRVPTPLSGSCASALASSSWARSALAGYSLSSSISGRGSSHRV